MSETLRGTTIKMTLEADDASGRRTAYLRIRFIMVSEKQIEALSDLVGQSARTIVKLDD